jgi:hypothetical protein
MTVVVGDPLYRPYASWLQLDAKPSSRPPNDWEAYHAFATKNSGLEPVEYFTRARQAASRAGDGPMIEDLGLMEKELGEYGVAVSCLRQARTIYKTRGDLFRVALEQADTLIQAGKKDDALTLVRGLQRDTPTGSPAAALLQKGRGGNHPAATDGDAVGSPNRFRVSPGASRGGRWFRLPSSSRGCRAHTFPGKSDRS